MSIEPVRKNIFVNTRQEHAFTVFTKGTWWPKEHSLLASGSPQKEVVIEPRVGGRWHEIGEDGTRCDWGPVLAWDPPRRLVLGWQINGNFECDDSAITEVEVNFISEGGGTRVELEHRGFENYPKTGQQLRDSVGSDQGWSGLLGLFAEATTAEPAPTPHYFVCKLHPPRPTFTQDMSETEGEVLDSHVDYWTALLETKRALIFGPVGDPAGVWGLAILAATDEAEAQKIADHDPAITPGGGFRYEVLPMLRAVVR